jgi:FixJ family two-component response regulator
MDKRPVHVAIVDDDPSVCKALSRLLAVSSFRPQAFASAEEFLDSLSAGVPECAVVDLHMPGMGGLGLQHRLAAAKMRIPTIIVTAHNETGFREQCESAGAVAYLQKPLNETALIAAINMAVGRVDEL